MRRVSEFLRIFGVAMLACSVQTLRVELNARRIGRACGMAVELATFSRYIMLTVCDDVSGARGLDRRTL